MKTILDFFRSLALDGLPAYEDSDTAFTFELTYTPKVGWEATIATGDTFAFNAVWRAKTLKELGEFLDSEPEGNVNDDDEGE